MSVRIIIGDALTELRKLSDESVHCCVTSPPYYGLRDYGCDGQIGLEPSPDEYVAALVAVFREVRRVLRNDGTLWLNIGDSYAGGGNYRGINSEESLSSKQRSNGGARCVKEFGCKPKDLIGIPWLLAFALRNDGWWLRSDIIWAKPNPMPESITDRPTKAHEYLFLLAKSERYYYDAEAISELAAQPLGALETATGRHSQHKQAVIGQNQSITSTLGANHGPATRNKRSVWTVATAPYSDAHFATFPPDLIEPCILAGSTVGGVVLDPFGGAGTTGLVADRLGRSATLIELNPTYAEMARGRIHNDAPLFAEVGPCAAIGRSGL